MSIFLHEALAYAEKGWHVFPIRPRSKAPLCAGGFKDSTVDKRQIRKWWGDMPTANIGIDLDASGLCVVDVDKHGEIDGFESLPALGDLPDTLTALTPSGGAHYIYSNEGSPPKRKTGVVPGVDLLANGYIVAAPSVMDGRAYRWSERKSWPVCRIACAIWQLPNQHGNRCAGCAGACSLRFRPEGVFVAG